MKKVLFKIQCIGLTLAALVYGNHVSAQNFGQFASAVFMTVNGTPNTYNVVGSGANLIGPSGQFFVGLGTFDKNSANLVLNGSEVKSYKNNGANVCGVDLYYRIISYGNTSNAFNVMSLPYKAGCSGGVFTDGFGPCSGNDQKWSTESNAVDLTKLDAGKYIMEVYFKMRGSSNNPSACDETLNLSWNSSVGALTRAMFYIRDTTLAQRNTVGSNIGMMATHANVSTYPSPVINVLNINAENFEDGAIQMQVTNIQGATSKNITATYTKGQSMTLDMSSYAAGMYFVRLQQGSNTAVAKVIK